MDDRENLQTDHAANTVRFCWEVSSGVGGAGAPKPTTDLGLRLRAAKLDDETAWAVAERSLKADRDAGSTLPGNLQKHNAPSLSQRSAASCKTRLHDNQPKPEELWSVQLRSGSLSALSPGSWGVLWGSGGYGGYGVACAQEPDTVGFWKSETPQNGSPRSKNNFLGLLSQSYQLRWPSQRPCLIHTSEAPGQGDATAGCCARDKFSNASLLLLWQMKQASEGQKAKALAGSPGSQTFPPAWSRCIGAALTTESKMTVRPGVQSRSLVVAAPETCTQSPLPQRARSPQPRGSVARTHGHLICESSQTLRAFAPAFLVSRLNAAVL